MPLVSSFSAASKRGFAGLGAQQYYSNLFVASQSDNITMPANSSLAPGTAAFTIEFFIYLNSVGAQQTVFSCGHTTTVPPYGFNIIVWTNGTLRITWPNSLGTTQTYASTTAISTGSWSYVVFTRRSTAIGDSQWYINGSSNTAGRVDGSFSGASSLATVIGRTRNSSNYLDAYLSNLRYRVGVGVSSSSVPTAPLTADANTVLLTCQSSTIIDNASPPNTLTNNGVTISTLNPF